MASGAFGAFFSFLPALRQADNVGGAVSPVQLLRMVRVMARHKPDIDQHEKALRPSLQTKLRQVRALHNSGYRPQVLHLHAADVCEIIADLGGAGFDVARGVVFRGIPVARVL